MKIGFIGLGIMGKPMAKNLIKAKYSLSVFDLNKLALDELVASGAVPCSSSKEVAAISDIIITMLPNSPHVKEVVLGQNGVIEGVKKGSILIDMSSISPNVSKEVANALKKVGVSMLDAPVSGGEPKAIEGTLAIMVGGELEAFNRVKDILHIIGASVTLVGEIGSGNMTKLANQIMVAANIAGVSEALVLAAKAGVDPKAVYNAVRVGLAGSTVLDSKAPMMLNGNFNPGFRIELHIKDLNNVLSTASLLNVPTPISDIIIKMMKELQLEGKGTLDHGGLVNYYEKKAGITIKDF